MLPTGGDGSAYVKYSNGGVVIGSGDSDKVTVTKDGDVVITKDLSVTGGQTSQLLYRSNPFQNARQNMSSSVAHLAEGLTRQAPVRAGSVVGLGMYSQNSTITAGALTASITINGIQQSGITLIMTAGTGSVATLSKDSMTFSAGAGLGIVLTASADYESSVAVTSGTFIGSLLIEQ